MSFDIEATFDDLPDCIKLGLRNNRRVPAPSHDLDHSRGGDYLELPVHPPADKHVAREQREHDLLGTVLPSAYGTIEGKIDFITFVRKRDRDGFLVLMARKKRVPIGSIDRTLNSQSQSRPMDVAPPSDLQETLTPNNMESCLGGSP